MQANKIMSEQQVLRACEELIRGVLPANWNFTVSDALKSKTRQYDSLLTLTSSEQRSVNYMVEVKRSPTAKSVVEAVAQLRLLLEEREGQLPLLAAGYLSTRSQEVLKKLDVSYVDTTGNIRLTASSPGLFVEVQGATKDPWPDDQPLRTLRGRGAGRAVRALVDTISPYGVRELSARTGVAAATLSRVIDLLERDAIVTRDIRGGVASVDWAGALRRWSQDYELRRSNTVTSYLEPRGLDALSEKLPDVVWRYAVTSSLAAQRFAPVAPARMAVLYVDDATITADKLGLRSAEAGANILLVEPFDEVVFERTVERDGITVAAPSQVAVDLLTGPGREPAEGEALIDWMEANEDAWRS
jgi:DNA-binding transcriptional ArsR family regulator